MMSKLMISLLITLVAFVVTVIFTAILLSIFSKKRIGQNILEIGPHWHMKKSGTPTMGGISFIVASIFVIFLICIFSDICENRIEIIKTINLIIYGILNGFIGIIDDIAKYRKRKNEGLKPLAKLILQTIASILFLALLSITVGIEKNISIPSLNISINLGVFYYPLAVVVLCGFVNAVNLTDGVDGLASSVSMTTGVFFFFISNVFVDVMSISIIGAIIIGITLGFLMYNFYPAKIFMGDTGSLFLGAIISGCAVLLNNVFLVLVYGFVFLIEALSVILQVGVFKISKGKRLLLMAPLHHHFEQKGWSEIKIVSVFTGVNAIFCVLALMNFI